MVLTTKIETYIKDDINQLNSQMQGNIDINIIGLNTPEIAIPKEGKAKYTGTGLFGEGNMASILDLTYNVDFSKRSGSGYLTKGYVDYNYGSKITLEEGTITKVNLKGKDAIGISSAAKSLNNLTGNYTLGFYGPAAEEIAGTLQIPLYGNNKEIGFGGTRGDIAK